MAEERKLEAQALGVGPSSARAARSLFLRSFVCRLLDLEEDPLRPQRSRPTPRSSEAR